MAEHDRLPPQDGPLLTPRGKALFKVLGKDACNLRTQHFPDEPDKTAEGDRGAGRGVRNTSMGDRQDLAE